MDSQDPRSLLEAQGSHLNFRTQRLGFDILLLKWVVWLKMKDLGLPTRLKKARGLQRSIPKGREAHIAVR